MAACGAALGVLARLLVYLRAALFIGDILTVVAIKANVVKVVFTLLVGISARLTEQSLDNLRRCVDGVISSLLVIFHVAGSIDRLNLVILTVRALSFLPQPNIYAALMEQMVAPC